MKIKKETVFFVIMLILFCGVLTFALWNFMILDESPSFFRTIDAYQNTSVQKYLLEDDSITSIYFETVKRSNVVDYLNETGFTEYCPNLSKDDFSVVIGENYILMINVKNYEVECDWVKQY